MSAKHYPICAICGKKVDLSSSNCPRCSNALRMVRFVTEITGFPTVVDSSSFETFPVIVQGAKRKRVRLIYKWYDFYIGFYWDRKKRLLYAVVFGCGIVFDLGE